MSVFGAADQVRMPMYVPSSARTNLMRPGGRFSSLWVHHSPRMASGGYFVDSGTAGSWWDPWAEETAGTARAKAAAVAAIQPIERSLMAWISGVRVDSRDEGGPDDLLGKPPAAGERSDFVA